MNLSEGESKIAFGLRQMKADAMKKPTIYIDHNLNRIPMAQADLLSRTMGRDFTVIREFENDTLFARITFSPVVITPDIPAEHWMPFKLVVENIMTTDPEGMVLSVPARCKDVDASNSFRTMQEAINSYEDLLVRHGGCQFFPGSNDDFGNPTVHLLVRGNKLAPPSKDMPIVSAEIDEAAIGSW
jgi:hypothetical protein